MYKRQAVQSVPEMDEKEFLMIHMPMTKDREQLKKAHEDGVNAVAEMLDRGKNIAFLTLGDVCIYSSCQYIYPVSYTHLDVYKRQK